MSVFCRHAWDVKDKTILPSTLDELGEQLKVMKDFKINGKFRGRTLVLTLACKNCGKLVTERTHS